MSNKILAKTRLSEQVYEMRVYAPLIAAERLPGQFIILAVDSDYGERIPLTIADADTTEGSITIVFQTVGFSTKKLALLNVGDSIPHLVGPLGSPTHIEKFGHCVCVGGGIGVAPLYPIVEALKKAGNTLTVIIGARTKELVIMEDRMRAIADEVIVCTDDGSHGRKDLVTAPLKEVCERDPKPDFAIIVGPPIMMKFCAETTRPFGVHTMSSLNSIMIDGTGMCGGCRVTVDGKTKFVCVDGPEFNAHQVDFDNLLQRLSAYKPQETEFVAKHQCKLDAMAAAKEKEQQ